MDELLSRKFHLNQVLNPQFTNFPQTDIKKFVISSACKKKFQRNKKYHKTSIILEKHPKSYQRKNQRENSKAEFQVYYNKIGKI